MDRVYLQWNLVNWITIVLMAALGASFVGLVSAGLRRYQGGNGGAE